LKKQSQFAREKIWLKLLFEKALQQILPRGAIKNKANFAIPGSGMGA
jgi:hypothetical protein